MTRMTALFVAALIAAAPVTASAQDRGRDRDRGQDRREEMRERREDMRERRMSMSEAQAIAQSRARGARFVGALPPRGDTYVFRFERDGQIIDIPVSARGN